jgi:hypothetical protein
MEVSSMGTVTVSLDKTYTKKAEVVRIKRYPLLTLDESIKAFIRDTLDAEVTDEDIEEKQ